MAEVRLIVVPSDKLEDTLRALEESLWRPETRFDRTHLDQVLAEGFVEFGRSGRRYDRAAILDTPRQEFEAVLPLTDFEVTLLGPGVALVTYRSVAHFEETEETEEARRSSMWVETADGWRLRFHQGTPLPPAAN